MPDIRNIPAEAWDWEKGTLKRGLLDNVCNELDKQALAFALGLRANTGGRIVSLSMGPPFAERVLRYALSVGADAGVLLTDRKLGGGGYRSHCLSAGPGHQKDRQRLLRWEQGLHHCKRYAIRGWRYGASPAADRRRIGHNAHRLCHVF